MKSLNALAAEVKQTTVACRLNCTRFGVRKALDRQQKDKAAQTFSASGEYIGASKKLLDNRHPAVQELTRAMNEAEAYWKGNTNPFPEPGIRLLKKDNLNDFVEGFNERREKISKACEKLQDARYEVIARSQSKLGSLFNEGDYPDTFEGTFDAFVDFPSIEPDLSLKDLAPAVFKIEQERIQQKMKDAVELIEAGFLHQFATLVKHLQDRITPDTDGKKKVFHETALTNLGDFFQQFKKLKVDSNAELNDLVAQAEAAVKGITVEDLKKSDVLKAEIAADIGKIASALDPLVAKMPRRSIIKPKDTTNAKSNAA